MPVRIQRKRTKGWKMPPNTVYVGRPTKWGNPYRFGDAVMFRRGINTVLTRREGLVRAFREYAERWRECDEHFADILHGKNLACWCPLDQPCHADVLLEIANSERGGYGGEHA